MNLLALRPLWIVLALGPLGVLAGGCEPEELTRSDFCARWAEAACSEEVVSVCQATTVEDCKYSQRQACDDELPSDLLNRGVDECIAAVAAAYEDADLTAQELEVVLRYGAPCNEVFLAGEGGGSCEDDSDCEPALRCVFKDEAEGECQDPVIVGAGLRCSAPEEMCEQGFFCDGKNCIAALEEGDDCQNHVQCGTDLYCDEVCLEKLPVGDACTKDAECSTGLCYGPEGDTTCANRLRLSPSESLCDSLR